jgi:hypothetical protein
MRRRRVFAPMSARFALIVSKISWATSVRIAVAASRRVPSGRQRIGRAIIIWARIRPVPWPGTDPSIRKCMRASRLPSGLFRRRNVDIFTAGQGPRAFLQDITEWQYEREKLYWRNPVRLIYQSLSPAVTLRVLTITTPAMTNAVPANCTGVRVSPSST